MCNLYSITTNQAAITALFRVVNRYVGNLAPMPGVFPDYPAPVIRNTEAPHRDDPDAVGHAATATNQRAIRHQHSQYIIAALARLAEAREPLPCAVNGMAEVIAKAAQSGFDISRWRAGVLHVQPLQHLNSKRRLSVGFVFDLSPNLIKTLPLIHPFPRTRDRIPIVTQRVDGL